MENKSFDDIIKSKIDQFSAELDASVWQTFEERQVNANFDAIVKGAVLDHTISEVPTDFDVLTEKMPSSFDAVIASKLASHTTKEFPTDFDALSEKMDPSFDALIGAKLASLSVHGGSDWDQFEKILDGDEVFDEKVAETVASHQAPLSESNWPKLAEHLRKVEKRRRRIVITKFVEAAVFLLFIITIMQLYPIQNTKSVYRTVGVTEDLNSQRQAEHILMAEDATIKVIDSKTNEAVSPVEIAIIASKQIPAVAIEETIIFQYRMPISKLSLPTLNLEVQKHSESQGSLASIFRRTSSDPLDIMTFHEEAHLDWNKLASLGIKDLEFSPRDFSSLASVGSSVKDRRYWFNLYSSPDINLINTPYDRSYDENRYIVGDEVEAYNNSGKGFSIGASISKETANLEIESGLQYTTMSYFPKEVIEQTGKATIGIKTTTLREIVFDIIEIPLNLKYTLFRKKGWKIYGNNGISAGVVAFAEYDISEGEGPSLAAQSLISPAVKDKTGDESFVDRKVFDEGFAKSGNLVNNTFATISAGFGVSKDISDRISFYVQPTYHHNLFEGGIGPNKDVHHRLSMQIGTKVRL